MKFLIKFSPEIVIKSRSVRVYFTKILTKNIRFILKKIIKSVLVICYWDYIKICILDKNKEFFFNSIVQELSCIPGIHHFFLIEEAICKNLDDIYDQTILFNSKRLVGKKFCVRVKRTGKHNFTSQDVERYIGRKLNQNLNDTSVNLTKPEEIVFLEIKGNKLFIIINRYEGLGGFPLGTQQNLLSLISGGFDSSVSSYMLIRKGYKVNYCFFNFGNFGNIFEVYKIAYYLWDRFSKSHKVKFISIDFSSVIQELFNKVKENQMGIILKRMMIRVASFIARNLKISALITGESLGQVSSQTLCNLKLIDNVSDCMILRPLIAYDKEKIISLSRKIGTEVLSRFVPEYCAVVSKKSTIKSTKREIELNENLFNFSILEKSIRSAQILDIRKIPNKILKYCFIKNIKVKTIVNVDEIILDIRTKEEQERNPLFLNNIKIYKIPFYKLINKFSGLNQKKFYFLYCDRGIMSRLQAMHLYQQGFRNVGIYRSN